jgi:cytochrome c-type biogenesis protein CcmH
MLFWVTLAAMTVLATLAVLVPLVRRRTAAAAPDLAIYRDQLAEVDRDLGAGLVTAAEAEAARVEVKRRLLSAADRIAAAGRPGDGRGRRWAVAAAGLVVVPLLAVGLYLVIGLPDLPDQPLAARQQATSNRADLAALIEQVEARLAENPNDGRGWEVLAPVYMRSGRYADAVTANQNALRVLGDSAERLANLGEAMFAAAGDKVTGEARKVFERAAAIDPKQPKARYFLGVADHQDGKSETAAARWRMQLAETAADSPWREVLEQSLAELAAEAAKKPLPGPRIENLPQAAQSAGQPPAAAPSPGNASPEAQAAITRAMVEMLSQKLKAEGGDAEDWMRLLRGHMTLGETDKARAALADARTALKGEPDKLKNVEMFAKGLGLGG